MLDKIKYSLLGLIMLLSMMMMAQPTDNSPFSSFGIGNMHDDNTVAYQGFGDLSASFIDFYHLNLKNPASYSFLRATAYEAGINAQYSQLSDQRNTSGIWKGSLDYLALGFPLRNPINASLDRLNQDYSLGMSLFLKPHSTVGYNIVSEFDHPEIGEYKKSFEGSGGTYKMMWGNSLRYKNFSAGVNVGYLFGNMVFEEKIDFIDFAIAFENLYALDYNVNGFLWDAGLLYNWFINKKAYDNNKNIDTKILNFGVYGNSAQRFYTKGMISERAVYPEATLADTLTLSNNLTGTGRLPMEIGFGATYYDGSKYAIGFNYEYGGWSAYENSLRNETLSNSYKLSLGGFYRPDVKAFNRYFKRVMYKYGLYYQQDPQIIENNRVVNTGINLGASFPFYYQRKISHVSLSFQFGMRGMGTPVLERYGRVGLGFTFNDDEWFLKRKYN